MSIAETFRLLRDPVSPDDARRSSRQVPGRLLALAFLFVCLAAFIICLRVTAPAPETHVNPFISLWLVSFLPYLLACVVILLFSPSQGRWLRYELALIVLGTLVLHIILLPLPPIVSRDAWRYLWDARVTLHGFSPYVYVPRSTALIPLRNILYDNSRYRDVPTLYPPGAQSFYVFSYLLAPNNLTFFKGILVVLEGITCVALMFLLRQRGMDPARSLLYAWCPLPIIEFSIQGHQEAITVMFLALTLVCTNSKWRGSRAMTGFLLAMATLTNLYPLLCLPFVLRWRELRREWSLLLVFILTIVLAYLPYIILSHGLPLGFFSTYASEQASNAGMVALWTHSLIQTFHWSGLLALLTRYCIYAFVVGGTLLVSWWLYIYERLSREAAFLLIIGAVFAISTHIYAWYNTIFLMLVPVLARPLWSRRSGWSKQGIVMLAPWYFSISMIVWYYFFYASASPDWGPYYLIVYDGPVLLLVVMALWSGWQYRAMLLPRRGEIINEKTASMNGKFREE